MENLKVTLEAAGCAFKDVVKISVFLANLDDRPKFHEVRKRYFKQNLPASTLPVVKSVANRGWLVEVEVVAEFPK